MDAKGILRNFVPAIARRSRTILAARPPHRAMDDFYRSLVRRGALCFDLGAHHGVRTASLRRVGCRVVALEPAATCFETIQTRFASDPDVVVLKQTAGAANGIATAITLVEQADGASSITEHVEVVTLDELITRHGLPIS